MVERRDRLGRLSWVCGACERRRAGVCRCCPRPVNGAVGRALYCAGCRPAIKRRDQARWYHADLEHARTISRRRARDYRAKRGFTPLSVKAQHQSEARLRNLTPERRREIARLGGLSKAARARAA
jgi:hypothetical protein